MGLAPIVLFAYNRPTHTQNTLDALVKNEDAKDSLLYIFCDGPKKDANAEQIKNIDKVRLIAKKENRFQSVTIIEQIVNKGLANSIIDGVTDIVNKHGKVIVLEDDLITAPYFLKFMNQSLALYEQDDEVACITGYIFPVKEKLPDTFFLNGADCWGWATWKRAWLDFEKDGKKLLHELEKNNLIREFDFEKSYPYTKMLRDQILGKNDSWAIRWYASAFLKNKLCLYPGKSLVQNFGFDGSGIHSNKINNWNSSFDNNYFQLTKLKIIEDLKSKKIIVEYLKLIDKNTFSMRQYIDKILKYISSKTQKSGWFGNYLNWQEAKKKCTGYDDSTILDKVKNSALKVKNGEAVYERDSIIFDKIHYNWILATYLLKAAIENDNKLNVIDFGGSLGSTYFQNKAFLDTISKKKWVVIEQLQYVDCGKKYFEDTTLNFRESLPHSIDDYEFNVFLASSVLQYIPNPYEIIDYAVKNKFKYIILDRLALTDGIRDILTIQYVSENAYRASLPHWFFSIKNILDKIQSNYDLIINEQSYCDTDVTLRNAVKCNFRLLIFKLKKK